MAVLAVLIAFIGLVAGLHQPNPHRLKQLRAIGSSIPEPRDLEHAKQLHQQASQAAIAIQQLHGHTTPTYHHQPTVLSTGYSSYASGQTINPIDFGADPSGKTDSTTAMLAAINAMLNVNVTAPKMASGIQSTTLVTTLPALPGH
jgi:hypothetical protein